MMEIERARRPRRIFVELGAASPMILSTASGLARLCGARCGMLATGSAEIWHDFGALGA